MSRAERRTPLNIARSSAYWESATFVNDEILETNEDELQETDHFPMHSAEDLPDEVVMTEKRFQEALKDRYYIRSNVDVRILHDVSLDKMLYYHYGFLLRNVHALSLLNQSIAPGGTPENGWATTRGIFYDVESSRDDFSLQEMVGITKFVQHLLDGQSVPAAVLDIYPDNLKSPLGRELRDVAFALGIQKTAVGQVA
ncbi:hypothetical protein ACEPAF_1115 [Sanghuangporus sanghuang]